MKVTVKGLTFTYPKSKQPVFKDLNFTFEPGTTTAITGASGSGKSTFLYVVALMLRNQNGQIYWGEQDMSKAKDGTRTQARANHAGYVFQDAMLDPSRSILENVQEAGLFSGMAKTEQLHRATELLTKFGVGHRITHKPGQISGGQAQRVALCRALLNHPGIIFGDEPTGNLDPDSSQLVWQALKNEAEKGATVIIATHDHELARNADNQLVL